MLNAVELFYQNYLDKLNRKRQDIITDNHLLFPGIYILVDVDKMSVKETLIFEEQKGEVKLVEGNPDYVEAVQYMDYYSKIIGGMNKTVASKSIITNNCLSLGVTTVHLLDKGSNEAKGIAVSDILEYFDRLIHIEDYKTGKKRDIYDSVSKNLNPINRKQAEYFARFCRNFARENFNGYDNIAKKCPYKIRQIKLFAFNQETYREDFKREGERFIRCNLFISDKYNCKSNSQVYGLPSLCFNANASKPFIMNGASGEPLMLVSTEDAFKDNLFHDLMGITIRRKHRCIFLPYDPTEEITTARRADEYPDKFCGLLVQIEPDKTKNFIVKTEPIFPTKHETITLYDFFNGAYTDEKNTIDYGKAYSLHELRQLVSEIFFRKHLIRNAAEMPDYLTGYLKTFILRYYRLYNQFFDTGIADKK